MPEPVSPAIAAVAAVMDEIDQCRNPMPCDLCRQRMQSVLDMGATAERERIVAALESLARDVTAFAPPSDGWNGPQRAAIQWGIRHMAHRLRNGRLTGGDDG